MPFLSAIPVALIVACATAPALAQPAPSRAGAPAIVSAQALHDRLVQRSRDLVLLHIGDEAGYAAAHLPGARRLWIDAISRSHPTLRLQMADPADLEKTFEALGVSDTSEVVLYFGKDQATPAARVFVALDLLGLGDRVSYLDGGLPAWTAAGFPVTTEVPAVAPGTLTPRPGPAIVDAAWVAGQRQAPGVAVVDARLPPFYSGEDDGGGRYARPGHIAGAKSVPFSSLLTDAGQFRPPAELAQVFAAAGVAPDDTVVSYCHIGQQASLVYFVARVLGHPARLYDGSFEEWSADANLPVERGAPSGPGR